MVIGEGIRRFGLILQIRCLLAACVFAVCSAGANAGVTTVPYAGTYNEATSAPGGDYDNIGGALDVGLFNLIVGNNAFLGSVYTPNDSSDVFAIGVGPGETLIGASLVFGTNLTEFNPLFKAPGPNWSLEESTITPTIFQIDDLGVKGGDTPITYIAPAFSRGEGIYLVTLGNGTFATNSSGPVGYSMNFLVAGPSAPIAEPATLALLAIGVAGLGLTRRKRSV